MAITINNVIGGVEVVFDADNKKVFPKESARLDFKQNKVYLSDVAPERGEIVTLTASDVTSPSVANNSLLFDEIRDMIYSDPSRAAIAATTGDNTIVAAVSGKKIRVIAIFGISDVAGTVRFEDGVSGTALTGQVNVGVTGGWVLPESTNGWFETSENTLLNLELVTAGNFDGCIVYKLI